MYFFFFPPVNTLISKVFRLPDKAVTEKRQAPPSPPRPDPHAPVLHGAPLSSPTHPGAGVRHRVHQGAAQVSQRGDRPGNLPCVLTCVVCGSCRCHRGVTAILLGESTGGASGHERVGEVGRNGADTTSEHAFMSVQWWWKTSDDRPARDPLPSLRFDEPPNTSTRYAVLLAGYRCRVRSANARARPGNLLVV